MTKPRYAAVLLLLVVLSTVLFLSFRRVAGQNKPLRPVGKAETRISNQPSNPLSLAAFYDQDPSFTAPGCWQAVPRGLQTFARIPFEIEGLIQLWGEGPAGIGRRYRESVEGIAVKGKFQSLYVLHACSFTTSEGTPIAALVFRYADGSAHTNLVHFGTDTRDWWQPQAEQVPLPTNSPSRVVWRGDHPSLPDWVNGLRLFGMEIPNPKPEQPVNQVDLYSTRSRVTWIVLAMTAGNSGLMKPDADLEREESTEEIPAVLKVLDNDSAQPVPNVDLAVTLLSGRRPSFYGNYRTDEKGEAQLDLPPQRLKSISVEATSADYPPQQMSWTWEQGQKIQTNYILKLKKTP